MNAKQERNAKITIRFLSGPLADKHIAIEQAVTAIGRDRQNDIVVLDQGVSRYHARLFQHNGSWTIENLSQSSFIAVNQQRIEHQGVLQHNSVVNLGEGSSFVFPIQQQTPAQPQSPADFQTVTYDPPVQSPADFQNGNL